MLTRTLTSQCPSPHLITSPHHLTSSSFTFTLFFRPLPQRIEEQYNALNVGSICKDGVGAVEKAVQQAEDLCKKKAEFSQRAIAPPPPPPTEAATLPANPGSGGNPSRCWLRLATVTSSVSEVSKSSVTATTLYTNSYRLRDDRRGDDGEVVGGDQKERHEEVAEVHQQDQRLDVPSYETGAGAQIRKQSSVVGRSCSTGNHLQLTAALDAQLLTTTSAVSRHFGRALVKEVAVVLLAEDVFGAASDFVVGVGSPRVGSPAVPELPPPPPPPAAVSAVSTEVLLVAASLLKEVLPVVEEDSRRP
ncbi:hypothetical protein TYRP_012745 [Tyrophagus putrescentiae]|nr:hypothetical protein TYRP_012745 [Tyrophagus putrescentiae]